MRIGKTKSFLREPIEVWRGNLRLGIVAARVAIAHVGGEDDDDVGAGGFLGGGGLAAKNAKRRKDDYEAPHGYFFLIFPRLALSSSAGDGKPFLRMRAPASRKAATSPG